MAVRLQQELFDGGQEMMALCRNRPDAGACVSFLGQMRDMNLDHQVHSMELEHYPSLAMKQLMSIEAEAYQRWPVLDSLIIHRFGLIQPCEPIVLVVTLSESRDAAFKAASFIMDFLKIDAPFWKAEHRSNGEKVWVSARAQDESSRKRW